MNVGLRFTQGDYNGYVFPASGYMDVGDSATPGKRSPLKLGRAYFTGSNPNEQAVANALASLEADYEEYGNEPNLKHEGSWTRASYRASFMRMRDLRPDAKLGYAGMSPTDDNNYTNDGGYLAWYAGAINSGADFVSAHVYGQTYDSLVATTEAILQAVYPLPLIISELNFGFGPGINIDKNAWARAVLRAYLLNYVRTRPRVLVTLYFADTWNADTPGATSVDARGTAILDVLAEAANLPTDWNIGTGFKKVRDQLGWTPLENEVYHFEGNPNLKASLAVFDLGHATWDPRSNATVAVASDGSVYTDGGNSPIDYGRLVKIR